MPARRHRFSSCNHLGFGAECHRCAQAAALEAIVRDKPLHPNAQSLTDEANRLRAPAGAPRRAFSHIETSDMEAGLFGQ